MSERDGAATGGVDSDGIDREKAVAADLFSPDNALEQEGMFGGIAAREEVVGGDWRESVAEESAVDGHASPGLASEGTDKRLTVRVMARHVGIVEGRRTEGSTGRKDEPLEASELGSGGFGENAGCEREAYFTW